MFERRVLDTGWCAAAAAAAAWLLLLLVAAPVAAQGGPGDGSGPERPEGRAELEERIRERMGEVVRRRLGLDEETADALADVLSSFEEERRALGRQEQATRRRVEALVLEGSHDESEANALLGRMLELRERELVLVREEQERLLEILTPAQVLHLQALRIQMGERIRAARSGERPGPGRDGRTPRARPGPGGGGGDPRTPGGAGGGGRAAPMRDALRRAVRRRRSWVAG